MSAPEKGISPLNDYKVVDAIKGFPNPIYDNPFNEDFTINAQNFEEPVEIFLSDTVNCERVLMDETKEDIFGSTCFENNHFSIEVFNYKGHTIINKININIVEIPLGNKVLTNINPSRLSSDRQILEWFNQETICDSFNIGSFENNNTIVKIIDELKLTERTYIIDLHYVIKKYLNYFRGYPITCVFGNIEAIYDHSQNFYRDLCLCEYDCKKIAETFLSYDILFEMYVQYIRNHLKFISYLCGTYKKAIQDRSEVLNDQLTMESHLLKPYQRLTVHSLLLQNIEKEHEPGKARTAISQAVLYLNNKLNRANSLVAIDAIKNCPFDLSDKGSLLLQDIFTKRRIKVQAFLFEEVIVFAEADEVEKHSFYYKSCIAMHLMYPIPTRNYQKIILTFKSVNGKKHVESVEIETPDKVIRKKWITCINQLLLDQLKKIKIDRDRY